MIDIFSESVARENIDQFKLTHCMPIGINYNLIVEFKSLNCV